MLSSLSNLKRRYRAIGIGESLTFILMTRPPVIVELPCSCILYGRTYTAHMSVIKALNLNYIIVFVSIDEAWITMFLKTLNRVKCNLT